MARRYPVPMVRSFGSAAIAAIVIGAGACGGSGHTVTAVSAAGAATEAARTFHVNIAAQTVDESNANARPMGENLSGVVDVSRHASDLTSTPMGTSSLTSTSGSRVCTETSDRVIVIGSDEWIESAASTCDNALPPPPHAEWAHVRLRTGTANAGSVGGIDPAIILQRLRSAPAVHLVGHETIDGIDTKHYSWSTARPLVIPTSVTHIHVSDRRDDAWVSPDGLLRRYRTASTATWKRGGQTSKQHHQFTFDLADFGVAATIAPPPADQVRDLPPRR